MINHWDSILKAIQIRTWVIHHATTFTTTCTSCCTPPSPTFQNSSCFLNTNCSGHSFAALFWHKSSGHHTVLCFCFCRMEMKMKSESLLYIGQTRMAFTPVTGLHVSEINWAVDLTCDDCLTVWPFDKDQLCRSSRSRQSNAQRS